jgi:hypothetical protein
MASRIFKTLAFTLALALPFAGRCLEPRPVVLQGQGYKTWMAPEDAKTWRMETLLYSLRQKNETLKIKALTQIGFQQERVGRSLMWRQWIEPIETAQSWLGEERRTLAVLWAPYEGKLKYCMLVMVRSGDDQNYWKPWQIFEFDTDPNEGLKVSFPDVLSDDIKLMSVRHLVKDDPQGNREVVTLFKNNERGSSQQLLPVWQETDVFYRAGKFQGEASWLHQSLTLGNQRIVRKLTLKRYEYTLRAEETRYLEAPYDKPKKVEQFDERFSWNPSDFSFYDSVTELEKLVRHKHAEVRAQAARRLGLMLSSTHPQLEKAMLSDKDARVRIYAALAIKAIADPKALASVRKGLANNDEDDTVKEALEQALAVLEAKAADVKPEESTEQAAPKPEKQAAAKPVGLKKELPGIDAVREPKSAPRK